LPTYTSIARPWAMEATRKNFLQWVEFAVFHIAVAVMIGVSFIIPYAPGLLTPAVVFMLVLTQIGGLVTCSLRLYRRYANRTVGAVSSPEDYFALIWVDVLFVACLWVLLSGSIASQAVYFLLVALIIVYVPFSKISHYVYFFFARFFFGEYFARRGIRQ
ncbi:MAG: hypothetical protein GX605_12860, partial [Chloroflexi bacterium]|nr:hypothetical protein [Chloroflexota bacterium]